MDASRMMVLIFSGHANDSAQVRREVERAISKGLPVLPFRVENVSPAGAMEYALGNTHWLDGFTKPLERQFELLAQSVLALLGKERSEVVETSGAVESTPARGFDRRLAALAVAAGVVLLGAAAWAIFRGDTSQASKVADSTKTESESKKRSPERALSDLERLQGRWQVIEHETPKRKLSSDELAALKPVWSFQENRLAIRIVVNGAETPQFRGFISLLDGRRTKRFDFNGSRNTGAEKKSGEKIEWRGIYEFDGDFLKLCYRMRRPQDDPEIERPDSFAVVHGPGGAMLQKLKRIAE
jgi:uncharacterized protein (TIGR03067 family)